MTLYGLLGASSGLVTDYSSVWVDYLLSIGRWRSSFPTVDQYDWALHPADVLDWVPGEVVDLAHHLFGEFLADVAADGDLRRRATARRSPRGSGSSRAPPPPTTWSPRWVKVGVLA